MFTFHAVKINFTTPYLPLKLTYRVNFSNFMPIIQRFIQPSLQSYFLLGPRGTGKSTWLKAYYPEAIFIDLLNPAEFRQYYAYPERLEELVHGSVGQLFVIDEIQKIPQLLTVVHRLIEEKQGWQFILTGSSARKLKQTGVDLLAGRAVMRYMHPFMAAELQEHFSFRETLQYGLVPLIIESPEKLDTLKSYVGLYLHEEVKSEGLVRNIGDFARFLEVMSFSHGCVLNVSNIARECGVSRKLIEGYLSVLQDLLLSIHLPVFTKRAKRELIAHEKFYYFDIGIYLSLRISGYLDRQSEIQGPGLEGLVLQHLRAWNDYGGSLYRLYYWRTKHGVEVDFIVDGPEGLYAIEIKHANIVHDHDLRGLKHFCTDYPEATPLLLYTGDHALLKQGIRCLPIDSFLKFLIPGQLLGT